MNCIFTVHFYFIGMMSRKSVVCFGGWQRDSNPVGSGEAYKAATTWQYYASYIEEKEF